MRAINCIRPHGGLQQAHPNRAACPQPLQSKLALRSGPYRIWEFCNILELRLLPSRVRVRVNAHKHKHIFIFL